MCSTTEHLSDRLVSVSPCPVTMGMVTLSPCYTLHELNGDTVTMLHPTRAYFAGACLQCTLCEITYVGHWCCHLSSSACQWRVSPLFTLPTCPSLLFPLISAVVATHTPCVVSHHCCSPYLNMGCGPEVICGLAGRGRCGLLAQA